MVESEAKELSEDIMLGAVMFGHRHFQPVIEAIIKLAEKAAKEPRELKVPDTAALETEIRGIVEKELRAAYAIPDKMERHKAVDAAKDRVMGHFSPPDVENPKYPKQQVAGVFKELEAKIVRWNILDTGNRPRRPRRQDCPADRVRSGRAAPRPWLSAIHAWGNPGPCRRHAWHRRGRAVHRRAPRHVQRDIHAALQLPAVLGRRSRPFRGPGRREIGHGNSCAQITRALIPSKEEFPYTIRVVSEIMSSNGSSSQATVCASALSLMDAGVPLKKPAAGIAMGLIKEEERYAVLSDILGDEDHLGDMDFKVAGTNAVSPRCRWTSRSPASPKRS